MKSINDDLARIYGLWLAEGDNKTDQEITFTNNNFKIVLFFHEILKDNFNFENKPRMYIYSPNRKKIKINLKDVNIRNYIDKRATKPYFLYRVYDKNLVKKWKLLQNEILKPKFYVPLFQGFFAGEGNVKYSEKCCSRVVRLAQKKRKRWIEQIFKYLNLKYKFRRRDRAYSISNRTNLEILYNIDIFKLHKIKKKKFEKEFLSYKQIHLPKNELEKLLIKVTKNPKTTRELSIKYKNSKSRISQVLLKLKKKGIVINFKAKNKTYWIKTDKRKIIISSRKKEYLNNINKPLRLVQISKSMGVCPRAAKKD